MKSKQIVFFVLLIIVLPCFLEAANVTSFYPPEVTVALDSAGTNRGELEKVLSHYSSAKDSLELQAAFFLIGNMEGHSYVTYVLQDTNKKEVSFNVLDYKDYNILRAEWDTLEQRYGSLDFEKKEIVYDLKTITADFLIKQIDYSFKAWREKPWAKKLSFEQFCEYVLPYRGSNEPLENWREFFWEKYKWLEKKMTNPSDPIEAAKLINNDVKSWFTFDPRYYYHPTDQGLSEMLKDHLGRCEDMTNVAIYAMRANGLAVTSDYTPAWANAGNNHAWNAIVTPDGKVIPFMGAEANPGEYHLANKLAKAYRKTFDKQKDNLAFQENKQKEMPGWLKGKSYKDVTRDYEEVCDVTVTFKKVIPDSVDIAYICVFNDGEWQPIHWGRIKNSTTVFTDMGKDIAYLPALYLNGKVAPYGEPFILRSDCSVQEIQGDEKKTISLILTSTTARKQEASTDGITKTFLTPGKEYELFYWKEGWQKSGSLVADDKPLVFEKVPAGCLYWLVPKDSNKEEERIFTIEDGKQVFW
jgi:hypothetical protein